MPRRRRPQRSSATYQPSSRVIAAWKPRSSRATGPLPRAPWASGSCQTDESIGSSVNETSIDSSTAKATVTPNCLKNLPMMPPMKPIGMNTATMEKVVASTARPISSVPSSAAS